jgi:hypothetical protein
MTTKCLWPYKIELQCDSKSFANVVSSYLTLDKHIILQTWGEGKFNPHPAQLTLEEAVRLATRLLMLVKKGKEE